MTPGKKQQTKQNSCLIPIIVIFGCTVKYTQQQL